MKGNASSCERLKVAVTGARSRFAHTRKRACGLAALAVLVMIVTSARAQPVCFSAHLNELGPIFSSVGHHVAISNDTAVVGAPGVGSCGQGPEGTATVFHYSAINGWVKLQDIEAPDAQFGAQFGRVVAIEEDIIAVASWCKDENASNSGSVYVFREVGGKWTFEQKIFLTDGPKSAINFGFGRSVVVNEGRIAVGAGGGFLTFDGGGETWGRVHIYEHDGDSWVQTHLISKDHLHPTTFATKNALAMRGDLLIAGSPADNSACASDPDWTEHCIVCGSGIAYIFRYDDVRNAWVEEASLLPKSVKCMDQFGWAVGIDENIAVVSAYSDPFKPPPRRVYIFEFDEASGQWIETAEIDSANVAATTNFGGNIDVLGQTALIGAGAGGAACSSAFVYQRTSPGQWIQRAVLTPQWTSGCNSFGMSVALGGEWAILGAPTQSPGGAAYIYDMQPPTGDLTCDDTVGVNDLLELLGSWGECPLPGEGISGCPGDLNGDGTVGVADLLILLANWG